MPGPRRRPVPTPPAGGRPKVAGLRRTAAEPDTGAAEPVVGPTADDPELSVSAGKIESRGTPSGGDPSASAAAEAPEAEDAAVTEEAAPAVEPQAADEARAAGEPEAAGKSQATELPPPSKPASDRPAWLLAGALLLVGLLLGGLGLWFHNQAGSVRYDAALVDTATTAEVNGQVREGVEKAFSYNFADIQATEKAANELLSGKAKCQYNAVFGPVRTLAPEQKLIVTVKVVASGVSSLKDDHATVLVFVDQVFTRTTDNQTGGGTAMLRVGAQRENGRWKIDNMDMFGQTPEQAKQLSECA